MTACCDTLRTIINAARDERLDPLDNRVLAVIVGMIVDKLPTTRAAIAAAAKCAPSSVPRATRKLAACGYLARDIDVAEGRASAPTQYRIVTDTQGITQDTVTVSQDTLSVSGTAPSTDGAEISKIPSSPSVPEGIAQDTQRVSAPPKNNIKPPRTTSTVGSSSENPETCGEGGPGEEGRSLGLFAQPEPVAKPKPAPEANMPAAMTARMRFDADRAGFKNGSGEEQFHKWRTYHVAKRSSIKDHEQSFRNWCGKANEFRGKRAGHYAGASSQPKTRNGIRRNPYINQII